MQRLRQIEHETDAHLERLAEAYAEHRGDPAAWRRDGRALELQRGQRADRQAQPLVPDRGAAADGSAVARLRQGRRPAVPARAARHRLGPRALSRVDFAADGRRTHDHEHDHEHDHDDHEHDHERTSTTTTRRRVRGRAGRGAPPPRARADPPVPGRRAAAEGARRHRVRRGPRPARRADGAADGRRPGRRARRDAGRRAPARCSSSQPDDEGVRRGRQPADRRAVATRPSPTRRAASRCSASACPVERSVRGHARGQGSRRRTTCATSSKGWARGSSSTRSTTSTAC